MSKQRKSLSKPRSKAFIHQLGYCYYCDQPMWLSKPDNFSSKYNISLKQTKRFQCTGEHLVAHQDGGTSKQANIVAACWFCNQQRHRRKIVLSPKDFKTFILKRMRKGHWHIVRLT